jgi:hypothetical protein
MARKSRNSLFLAQDEIESRIGRAVVFRQSSIIAHGSECAFIPISDTTAIKLFYTRKERNHAFAAQTHFYKKKVAPKTGQCYDFKISKNIDCKIDGLNYGYTTEIASPYPFPARGRKMYFIEYLKDYERETLINAGLPVEDLHGDNIGIIDDRVVAVDFGPISCPGKYVINK